MDSVLPPSRDTGGSRDTPRRPPPLILSLHQELKHEVEQTALSSVECTKLELTEPEQEIFSYLLCPGLSSMVSGLTVTIHYK